LKIMRLLDPLPRLVLLCAFALPLAADGTHWRGGVIRDGVMWPVDLALTIEGGSATALVDLPAIEAYARPFSGTIDGDRLTLERISPLGARLRIDGTIWGSQLRGRWTGFGTEGDLILDRSANPYPGHREEAVTFKNGAVTLAGTIVLPERRGRYRGVVTVHGSGPQTRHFGLSRAVFMARSGVAALVYDKRGTGESSGTWETASMHDLAHDALAAVTLLEAHAEVEEVGIEGYSQGGWIAPLAATMNDRVRFVVAGGLAGVTPMEQTIHHRTEVMKAAGFDGKTIDAAMALWRKLWGTTFGTHERGAVEAEIAAVRSEPWFESSAIPYPLGEAPPETVGQFLAFDPEPVWARVRVPVWLYWGDRDINVPVLESRAAIAGALIAGGNRDMTLRMIADADHGMMKPDRAGFPRIQGGILSAITRWMREVELG
jgi:pimeloyl-ACP methyl ester carboxylesterase